MDSPEVRNRGGRANRRNEGSGGGYSRRVQATAGWHTVSRTDSRLFPAGSGHRPSAGARLGPVLVAFGPARAAQPPGGPWANARILRRAWPSSAYEGWPRLRLMTSFRAWRTTRPGGAFHRLHIPSKS